MKNIQSDIISFSIIIPHHNIPHLLRRCLDSIPRRPDIEIIVVDDNSSPEIVDFRNFPGINDVDIKILLTKEGRGAGYARNQGLKVARGTWLIFADADDFFSSEFEEIIERYKENSAEIIYFNVDSVYSDDIDRKAGRNEHKARLFGIPANNKEERELFFRYNYPEPWGKMVRRDLVSDNHVCFDETFICNDLFFSTKIGHLAKEILAVDRVFYFITLRENSLSNNTMNDFAKLSGRITATTKVYLFLKEMHVSYKINPLRGLMVMVLKRHPLKFFKTLKMVKNQGVNIRRLILEIFDYRLFSK